jgi:esterase/lipase
VRIISILKRLLSVNIKLHHDEGQVADGEIFLFNHFARFETFIPQYLIYQEDGSYCRSIAADEFFSEDDGFSNYLLSVGAVPNNYQKLMPFLAREILRGRKVIIFPEGGMVKDRRVHDRRGRYRIYSRSAKERRKHHTGAAVLSLKVDLLKQSIKSSLDKGDNERIEYWLKTLELGDRDALNAAVQRKSTIVPANITFYPMRVGDNLLRRGVELFNSGISKRLSEELLIEGNILLKNTDMDIRLGDVIRTAEYWKPWERPLTRYCTRCINTLDDLLVPNPAASSMDRRYLSARIRRNSGKLRDSYMRAIYNEVTINLSHLASLLIFNHLEDGIEDVGYDEFHTMLYLAVKYAQKLPHINLHRSLRNPDAYYGLLNGSCDGLDQFFRTTSQLGLIELEGGRYRFMPKLCEEHDFDVIRMENLVEVYANEASPVAGIFDIIQQAISKASAPDNKELAEFRFNDMNNSLEWDRKLFSKPRHQEINRQETATEPSDPFFILPENHKSMGVVLVHGFLSTPAEVKEFGSQLAELGYPVIGPRLKGHGTSPWDLRERGWEDWLDSARQAYDVVMAYCDRICLVGFSTGGLISLLLASEQLDGLAGVVSISAPMKFVDKNMVFVPLLHTANKLVSWLPAYEGIIPFRYNSRTENPHINYRSMPVHGLFELRLIVNELEERLKNIRSPVLVVQGDQDPIVDQKSAAIIMDNLGSKNKQLEMIESKRHGILYGDVGSTRKRIIEYMSKLSI